MGNQSPACSKKQNRSKTPLTQNEKAISAKKNTKISKQQPPTKSRTPIVSSDKNIDETEDFMEEINESLDFLGNYLQYRDVSEVIILRNQ